MGETRNPTWETFFHLKRTVFIGAILWTILLSGSLLWHVRRTKLYTLALGRKEALATLNKDWSFILWAAKHGGLYVPTTQETPPNPFLSHIPDRDIPVNSGKTLTLMNSAYALRQIMKDHADLYELRGHLTSLKAMNPLNSPDPWERRALEAFEKGEKEVLELTYLDGNPYLRLMRPMIIRKECLKCHGGQEYKPGDVRGGIGVAVPMTPYNLLEKETIDYMLFSHSFIWITGIFGAGMFFFSSKRKILDRQRVEDERTLSSQRTQTLLRINQMGATSLHEITDFALEEAVRLTKSKIGYLAFLNEDESVLTMHSWSRSAMAECAIIDKPIIYPVVTTGLWGEAVRQHKAIITNDYTAPNPLKKGCPEGHVNIRRHMNTPIFMDSRIVLVAGVGNKEDDYDQNDVQQLTLLMEGMWLLIERKRVHEELEKHREHLEELVKIRTAALQTSQNNLMNSLKELNIKKEELEEANSKLQELDRLKSMFIASMSHELRTPLNSIIGFTGIILQGMTGDINNEQRDQLTRVSRAGKHLLALITDVIDISKIEAGKMDAFAEEFQLDNIIQNAASEMKLQIREKGLELEVLPSSIILKTDKKRLYQCILNYISNAIKYSEKGKIRIWAENLVDQMRLNVSDNGIGIKEEDFPILFQSFVRLDSNLKLAVSGTGLGLYLTKKLVTEVLNGDVSVTSVYGKGSTFSLTIPKELNKKPYSPNEPALPNGTS
ncbi:MAG: GAF domain-containing protein [Candidatus Riflebacteria bacterium]|nr:GAF domain-containing protein [Candidatus Riflebacteria bacterium]